MRWGVYNGGYNWTQAKADRPAKDNRDINLSTFIATGRDFFLDLLFPKRCVACDKHGALICGECESRIPVIGTPLCHRCGNEGPNPCLCIAAADRVWPLDGIRSGFEFKSPIREAILALKFANLRSVGNTLATYLTEVMREDGLEFDVLTPVPLHKRRLRQRGYNQSEIVAASLGKKMGIDVDIRCLRRVTYAGPQARASTADERRANVAHAFVCRPGRVEEKRVAVIDDVTTTGATLRACAAALKRGGAAEVWGITVAREL